MGEDIRLKSKAGEIGVGVSTLRRWVKDFGESGPAGLADDRWKRRQDYKRQREDQARFAGQRPAPGRRP